MIHVKDGVSIWIPNNIQTPTKRKFLSLRPPKNFLIFLLIALSGSSAIFVRFLSPEAFAK